MLGRKWAVWLISDSLGIHTNQPLLWMRYWTKRGAESEARRLNMRHSDNSVRYEVRKLG